MDEPLGKHDQTVTQLTLKRVIGDGCPVAHEIHRSVGVFFGQLLTQLGNGQCPILAEAGKGCTVAIEQRVVHLLTAGVHAGAENTVQSHAVESQRLQSRHPNAGLALAESHALHRSRPDADPRKGAGARRTYEQLHIVHGVARDLQNRLHHGEQGLGVGVPRVQSILGDQPLILAKSHRAHLRGGIQSQNQHSGASFREMVISRLSTSGGHLTMRTSR